MDDDGFSDDNDEDEEAERVVADQDVGQGLERRNPGAFGGGLLPALHGLPGFLHRPGNFTH